MLALAAALVAATSAAASSPPPGNDDAAGLAYADCPSHTVPWPTADPAKFACEPEHEAAKEASKYLLANMFSFDKTGGNKDSLVDGIFGNTVNKSLTARQRFPWAAAVPKALFLSDVLPYAVTNEARTNWRDLLWSELSTLMSSAGAPTNTSLAAAATYLNLNMWSATALGKFNVTNYKRDGSIMYRTRQMTVESNYRKSPPHRDIQG